MILRLTTSLVGQTAATVTAALVVLIGLLLVVAAGVVRRHRENAAIGAWHDSVHLACAEAVTIVDLTTPAGTGLEPPGTTILTTVGKRIHRLDRRLQQLADGSPTVRIAEAVEDVRRVALALASAVDAERSLRLGSAGEAPARQQSVARIASRSAELNLATDELQWLVETAD